MPLEDKIDALLPQTQCTQCGFDGCRPYAKAIAEGVAHNQCPPGGERVIKQLSKLLKRDVLPLNPDNGIHTTKVVAKIVEIDCIGCTKCIQACPVDAIAGATRLMHTVIESECTGCELCVEPCPVDCIELVPAKIQPDDFSDTEFTEQGNHYRDRLTARNIRVKKRADAKKLKHKLNRNAGLNREASIDDRKAFIAEALERTKKRTHNERFDKLSDPKQSKTNNE